MAHAGGGVGALAVRRTCATRLGAGGVGAIRVRLSNPSTGPPLPGSVPPAQRSPSQKAAVLSFRPQMFHVEHVRRVFYVLCGRHEEVPGNPGDSGRACSFWPIWREAPARPGTRRWLRDNPPAFLNQARRMPEEVSAETPVDPSAGAPTWIPVAGSSSSAPDYLSAVGGGFT